MGSIEEKVEEHYKSMLDSLGIRHYGKTEKINQQIDSALQKAKSKSGNDGNNYPDIRLLIENDNSRRMPVMIEAKGQKDRLIKANPDTGEILGVTDKNGELNYSNIIKYAVNGAVHYGNAILEGGLS